MISRCKMPKCSKVSFPGENETSLTLLNQHLKEAEKQLVAEERRYDGIATTQGEAAAPKTQLMKLLVWRDKLWHRIAEAKNIKQEE